MSEEFAVENLYSDFDLPIAAFDCGQRCAPYNEGGIPFCCDIQEAVPTAYHSEWKCMQARTELWHLYQNDNEKEMDQLVSGTPEGQILLACKGYEFCERNNRLVSCRAFPFFPYISRAGEFLGLSCLWDFEDRCWLLSHLEVVQMDYLRQFVRTFDEIFLHLPGELERYRGFSSMMRRAFGRRHRSIPVLQRNGYWYKTTPRNGRMRRVSAEQLPKFGWYLVADSLRFPDEIADETE